MSMLCSVYRVSEDAALRLKEVPGAVGEFLGLGPPPKKVGFFSKVFRQQPGELSPPVGPPEPAKASDCVELQQSWHILHFLFCGRADESGWPAGFLLSGGEKVGPDHGYGPARLLAPEQSREVAGFLGTLSLSGLDAVYMVAKIEAAGVYWKASASPTERQRQVQELWGLVEELNVFYEHTTLEGEASLISIY